MQLGVDLISVEPEQYPLSSARHEQLLLKQAMLEQSATWFGICVSYLLTVVDLPNLFP